MRVQNNVDILLFLKRCHVRGRACDEAAFKSEPGRRGTVVKEKTYRTRHNTSIKSKMNPAVWLRARRKIRE
jgi:hypothetical protein